MRASFNCSNGICCHTQAINCAHLQRWSWTSKWKRSLLQEFSATPLDILLLLLVPILTLSPPLSLPLSNGADGAQCFKRTPGYVTKTNREPIIPRLEHLQEAHSPEHAVTAAVAAASGRDYSRHVHPEYTKDTPARTHTHTNTMHTYTHTRTRTHPDAFCSTNTVTFMMFSTK